MWELDYKESWVPKNWCFWTVVLEKTLESPLRFPCKEIQPVHPKGNQSWMFIERTDVEAKTPILWPLDAKNWLLWKDPDAGKDWGQEEKGMTEDEMAGWHHRLNGHGFGWAPGVDEGQGGLACCDSRDRRVGHDWATKLTDWTVRPSQAFSSCEPQLRCLFREIIEVLPTEDRCKGYVRKWIVSTYTTCAHRGLVGSAVDTEERGSLTGPPSSPKAKSRRSGVVCRAPWPLSTALCSFIEEGW